MRRRVRMTMVSCIFLVQMPTISSSMEDSHRFRKHLTLKSRKSITFQFCHWKWINGRIIWGRRLWRSSRHYKGQMSNQIPCYLTHPLTFTPQWHAKQMTKFNQPWNNTLPIQKTTAATSRTSRTRLSTRNKKS